MSNTQELVDLAGLQKALGNPKVTRGFSPGPATKRRWLVMGHPGTGKTSVAYSAPCLVLDAEDSGRDIQAPVAARFGPAFNTAEQLVIPTIDDYCAMMDRLIVLGKAGKHPVPIVCWDTIDEMVDLFAAKFCGEVGVGDMGEYKSHGAGYALVRNRVFGYYDKLWQAGYGLIVVAHLTKKTVVKDGGDVQVTTSALSDSFKRVLYRRSQHLLFASKKSEVPHTMKPVTHPHTGEPVLDAAGKPLVSRVNKPGGKMEETFTLSVRTPEGPQDETKVRIPFLDTIKFGPHNAWDLITEGYERAVDEVTNTQYTNQQKET